MDIRKLSQLLIIGGIAIVVLAVGWWMTSFASAFDTSARYVGESGSIFSCLYSSSQVCSAWALFGDGSAPSYSPVVFWIGAIALLAGLAIRFSAKGGSQSAHGSPQSGDVPGSPAAGLTVGDKILGVIPASKYVTVTYALLLLSALIGFVLPMSIVGFAGLVLGLLGLFVFKSRLSMLDGNHLAVVCVIYAAGFVLTLLLMRAGFLLLLLALAQLAAYYIGFNSYRHGRAIGIDNVKTEIQLALKHK